MRDCVRETDRQIDRQTERQTERQTDRQRGRQTDKQIDRQTGLPDILFLSLLQIHSVYTSSKAGYLAAVWLYKSVNSK